MAKKEEHISLKEAAKMSGYSPDYVGQLIRAGKLKGKQVFSNVAWVTTEEAILEYISKNKKGVDEQPPPMLKGLPGLLTEKNLLSFYTVALWGTAVVLSVATLFLLYALIVSIDHRIEQTYLDKKYHE